MRKKKYDEMMFRELVGHTIDETFNKDTEDDVVISFEKTKKGKPTLEIKGKNIELLVALLAVEQILFEYLKVSDNELKIAREIVGVKGFNE